MEAAQSRRREMEMEMAMEGGVVMAGGGVEAVVRW